MQVVRGSIPFRWIKIMRYIIDKTRRNGVAPCFGFELCPDKFIMLYLTKNSFSVYKERECGIKKTSDKESIPFINKTIEGTILCDVPVNLKEIISLFVLFNIGLKILGHKIEYDETVSRIYTV